MKMLPRKTRITIHKQREYSPLFLFKESGFTVSLEFQLKC